MLNITAIDAENIINYNFTFAAILGLVFVLVIVAFFVGSSRLERVRRKPE